MAKKRLPRNVRVGCKAQSKSSKNREENENEPEQSSGTLGDITRCGNNVSDYCKFLIEPLTETSNQFGLVSSESAESSDVISGRSVKQKCQSYVVAAAALESASVSNEKANCPSSVSKTLALVCTTDSRIQSSGKNISNNSKEKESAENEGASFNGDVGSEAKNDVIKVSDNKGPKKASAVQHTCSYCSASFKKKSQLAIHIRGHTGQRPFKCSQCTRAYPKLDRLKVHLKTHSGELPFCCSVCDKTFPVKSKLNSHMKCHQPKDGSVFTPTPCDVCGANLTRKSQLDYHRSLHARKEPLRCEKCGTTFKHPSSYRMHLKAHRGELPYKCALCQAAFITRTKLKAHIRRHTGEKPYACDVCSFRFTSSSGLHAHKRTHTGERPFVCQICQVAFARKCNMESHMLTHAPDKPFQCSTCGIRFSQEQKLINHEAVHSGKQTDEKVETVGQTGSNRTALQALQCDYCQKPFRSRCALVTHQRIHTGEKPYQCVHCPAAFAQKISLKVHMRSHTGEKPFQCVHCSAAFTQSGHLTSHLRTHTGEKPFKCSVCSSFFSNYGNLLKHNRIHTGEKPYRCEICSKGYHRIRQLEKHMISAHQWELVHKCQLCPMSYALASSLQGHMRVHNRRTSDAGDAELIAETYHSLEEAPQLDQTKATPFIGTLLPSKHPEPIGEEKRTHVLRKLPCPVESVPVNVAHSAGSQICTEDPEAAEEEGRSPVQSQASLLTGSIINTKIVADSDSNMGELHHNLFTAALTNLNTAKASKGEDLAPTYPDITLHADFMNARNVFKRHSITFHADLETGASVEDLISNADQRTRTSVAVSSDSKSIVKIVDGRAVTLFQPGHLEAPVSSLSIPPSGMSSVVDAEVQLSASQLRVQPAIRLGIHKIEPPASIVNPTMRTDSVDTLDSLQSIDAASTVQSAPTLEFTDTSISDPSRSLVGTDTGQFASGQLSQTLEYANLQSFDASRMLCCTDSGQSSSSCQPSRKFKVADVGQRPSSLIDLRVDFSAKGVLESSCVPLSTRDSSPDTTEAHGQAGTFPVALDFCTTGHDLHSVNSTSDSLALKQDAGLQLTPASFTETGGSRSNRGVSNVFPCKGVLQLLNGESHLLPLDNDFRASDEAPISVAESTTSVSTTAMGNVASEAHSNSEVPVKAYSAEEIDERLRTLLPSNSSSLTREGLFNMKTALSSLKVPFDISIQVSTSAKPQMKPDLTLYPGRTVPMENLSENIATGSRGSKHSMASDLMWSLLPGKAATNPRGSTFLTELGKPKEAGSGGKVILSNQAGSASSRCARTQLVVQRVRKEEDGDTGGILYNVLDDEVNLLHSESSKILGVPEGLVTVHRSQALPTSNAARYAPFTNPDLGKSAPGSHTQCLDLGNSAPGSHIQCPDLGNSAPGSHIQCSSTDMKVGKAVVTSDIRSGTASGPFAWLKTGEQSSSAPSERAQSTPRVLPSVDDVFDALQLYHQSPGKSSADIKVQGLATVLEGRNVVDRNMTKTDNDQGSNKETKTVVYTKESEKQKRFPPNPKSDVDVVIESQSLGLGEFPDCTEVLSPDPAAHKLVLVECLALKDNFDEQAAHRSESEKAGIDVQDNIAADVTGHKRSSQEDKQMPCELAYSFDEHDYALSYGDYLEHQRRNPDYSSLFFTAEYGKSPPTRKKESAKKEEWVCQKRRKSPPTGKKGSGKKSLSRDKKGQKQRKKNKTVKADAGEKDVKGGQEEAAKKTLEVPTTCDTCGVLLRHKSQIAYHRRIHSGEPYCCSECQAVFAHRSSLRHHLRIHSGVKTHSCALCQKSFFTKTALRRHTRHHTGEKPYICETCQFPFSSSSGLIAHRRTHTGERPFVCSICQASFARKGNMLSHMSLHSSERQYKCHICPSQYAEIRSFKRHLRRHAENKETPLYVPKIPKKRNDIPSGKDLTCRVCQKVLAHRSSLILHYRTHSGEKPFQCDLCQSAFSQRVALKVHMRSHTKEKPYKCQLCDAAFCQSGNLANHMRKHTGEKPFKCSTCEATFALYGNLKQHQRMHTGEKPHKCDLCSAGFGRIATLEKHMASHNVSKEWHCNICGASFALHASLKSHTRTHSMKELLSVKVQTQDA